jgi:ABC-type transport system substrate-binding protein
MVNAFRCCTLIVACALLPAFGAYAQTLRSASPRIPTSSTRRSRALRRPHRVRALCDKLFDIDEKLTIVPQLATAYEWSADSKALTIRASPDVTFHDGEKLDAAAVKYSLERHKTMAGLEPARRARAARERRRRRSATVRLNLSAPFSPAARASSPIAPA